MHALVYVTCDGKLAHTHTNTHKQQSTSIYRICFEYFSPGGRKREIAYVVDSMLYYKHALYFHIYTKSGLFTLFLYLRFPPHLSGVWVSRFFCLNTCLLPLSLCYYQNITCPLPIIESYSFYEMEYYNVSHTLSCNIDYGK